MNWKNKESAATLDMSDVEGNQLLSEAVSKEDFVTVTL